jgi:integrase/recombinase XerD
MASLKVLLWDKKNKDNLYPIAIRIIKDRKPSYIYIGHYIEKDQWDAKNHKVKKHPNAARLNNLISKKLSEANDKLLDLEVQKNDSSSHAIKKSIKSAGNSLFSKQSDIYLNTLKESGKYNRHTADKPRIERFKAFLKASGHGSDIAFSEITPQLLNSFKGYLKAVRITTKKEDERRLSERTIVNYLIVLRTIFNQAIGANVVDRKYYPFGKGKIVIKFPETNKIGLTPQEVKQLEDVELPEGAFENHCRNLWLFSFYFAGMRVSDVLRIRWSDIQNDRLYYMMGKNSKGGSLKIPEKALRIINQYREQQRFYDDHIFPDLKVVSDLNDTFIVQRRIMNTASRADKFLRNIVAPAAKIEKKLTMHIARHTFGNISGDRIPIQMLQKLYRHTSITTTIGYQSNFIHKDTDGALDLVLGF